MLTRPQRWSLSAQLRRVRGRCLQRGAVLEKWLKENPDVDPREARYFASTSCRSPFPPIDGPKPKYRNRPFFDARFEGEWKDDNG